MHWCCPLQGGRDAGCGMGTGGIKYLWHLAHGLFSIGICTVFKYLKHPSEPVDVVSRLITSYVAPPLCQRCLDHKTLSVKGLPLLAAFRAVGMLEARHMTCHVACQAGADSTVGSPAVARRATAHRTMRGVIFREFGPPSTLELVDTLAMPVRKPGEVLVQVHATSVNPVDCKIRRGDIPFPFKQLQAVRPKVLGGDVVGVVVDADKAASIQPGTRVAFLSDGFSWSKQYGSYAESITAPESQVAVLPDDISFLEAAGLPLVTLTALQALNPLSLQPGQRVLIHAGAGGVGSAAVQIAKARGLHVTATCSTRNVQFVWEELGADAVVDYTQDRFEQVCRQRPFDAILDLVGGDYEPRSLMVLKKWGTYVSVLAKWDVGAVLRGKALNWEGAGPGPRYNVVIVQPSRADMEAALRLVQQRRLKPIIDKVLPLEQAREAHEHVERGHTRGKVILTVRDDEAGY